VLSDTETRTALPFSPTADTLDAVVVALERAGPRSGGAVDAARRREAFARFKELPAPGTRPGRSWKHDYDKLRYDDLSWSSERTTMATVPLRAPAAAASDELAPEVDRPALATENSGGLFHLGPTLVEPATPAAADDARIVVLPLADALRTHADLVTPVHGSVVDWRADRFAALSTAFQNCGAFVHVPAGVALDAPIQLVFANSEAEDAAVFPHVVVVLGAGARATVLERHVGAGEPLVSGIVEVQLGEGAQLDYAAVQQAGDDARVLMARGARCERNAAIRWHLADLGGTLVRTTLDAQLDAPGAHAQTSALFFNTGAQHVDLTTTVDHRVPNTTSDTVVRSAATDRGQGRYFGNIVIRKFAHGSDASLRDDALLLSKRAHIDSVPALEIAANDVKAFHGATVGSLDETALFYVSSRGIARPQAVRMIALAFFEPAISRFPGEALRDEVRTALDRKIDAATEIDA
jgi:Fe-S cluster assembly protein SufD